MGRRKKSEATLASDIVAVRFTPSEKAALIALAESVGATSVSHLVRSLVMDAVEKKVIPLASSRSVDLVPAAIAEHIERALHRALSHYTPRRRHLSSACRSVHLKAVSLRGGLCPCCSKVRIVAGGSIVRSPDPVAEFDHFFACHLAEVETTWLICNDCHRRITESASERRKATAAFNDYQNASFGHAAGSPQEETS